MELLLIKHLDFYKSPGKHVWKESREPNVRKAGTTQEQGQARLAQPEGQLQRQESQRGPQRTCVSGTEV